MTKEVDFLSLSKASNNKISNTSNTNKESKKEGLSLFDSLLVANKTEDTTTSLTKDNDLTKASLNNQTKEEGDTKKIPNTTSEVKTLENKEDTTKIENSKTINLNETEKSEIKSAQSSSSLLDKIIIESKKNIKTTEVDIITKNANTNNTLIKNEEINIETPKELNRESNPKDQILKEVKVEIGNKNIENSSLTKENRLSEVDISIKNTNANNTLIKNHELNKENSKELENKDTSENKLLKEVKVEVEKNDIDIKKEPKAQINDTKDIKINTIKEQAQATIDFEESSNEQLVDELKKTSEKEVKPEIKSLDNLKNIAENNTINTNIMEESKNTSKVEIKNELKTDIKIDNNIEENKTFVGEKESSNNTQKINNDVVSKEFGKLDSSVINEDEQRINFDKNILSNNNSESKNTKSLMDKLLDNATRTVNLSTNSSMSINQDDIDLQVQTTSSKTNEFVTNIFLGSQKNSIYNQMIANRSEGVKVVKDGKNLEDIKKGAEILNLGLEDASVESEVEKDSSKINTNKFSDNKENILNKLVFDKNTNNQNIENKLLDKQEPKILNTQTLTSAETTSSTLSSLTSTLSSTSTIEEPVTLAVSPTLALSIQNKIIGAQQHMSSMMSDVARNMYENYKPPVTAFRLNLFPAQLGQIAILMKNDKENSISISLNMSNSNTLDAFVENQSVLRDALNRNFNNNQTTFNLDFNLDSESSGKESFNNQNQEDNKDNETASSNEIIEAINQNQNIGEDLNYL